MKKQIVLSFLVVLFVMFAFMVIKPILFHNQNDMSKELRPIAAREDDPFAASRFRYEMLSIKGSETDIVSARQQAINSIQTQLKSNSLYKTQAISWLSVGPGNIGGRIRSIIINPSAPDEILIGSVSGGIWKTTNGGTSWSPKLDSQDPIAISCITLVGATNLYAGTGEAWSNIDAVYGGGIYKSTNFGDTWTLLPSTIGANIWNFKNVLKLASDPSGNIYAVTKAYNNKAGIGGYYTDGGLYRSTNGGSSWINISSTDFATNFFNGCDVIPISSSTILFAVNANGATLGGIYRTTDSGTSWTKISSNLPSANYARIAMTQDPNSASTIYAVFESSNTGSPDYGLKGIYKSVDAGISWTALSTPAALASTNGMSFLSTQGWYDNVIVVDPFNSNNIYLGGVELMKSTNAGTSWTQLTYWHPFYGTPVVHADHHSIVFDLTSNGKFYSGNDGGIYKTTDGGTSWSSLNNGLEITQFYGGAVYPSGTTYFGGTQDNGHLKYSSGTNWTQVYGGDGGYVAQNQTDNLISYEEYVYLQMSKTTNGGSTWSTCYSGLSDAANSSLCLFIAPFSMNPENSNVLIAGSDNVWITNNSAGSWTSSSNTLSAGAKVSAVTVTNSTANYLGFAGTTNGKIFKCTSLNPAAGTDTWTEITPVGNNGAWVRRIVVDLTDKNKIYACYSGYNNTGTGKHIWYSTNQGTSWTDISTSLADVPVHSLVIHPTIAGSIYIGTEIGVWSTTNNGTSWTVSSSGMPDYVPIDELVYQTGTMKLFAFTHGRGVWITDSPLPVELSSFIANYKNNNVQLDWITKTEVNNFGFNIERKIGTKQSSYGKWETIGFVNGNGNSNSTNSYSFKDDKLPYANFVNYRLKQIDNDGKFEYSDEIEISIAVNEFRLEQNYPNPFNPSTSISFSLLEKTDVTLSIYTLTGELVEVVVSSSLESGRHTYKWNSEKYSSGIYIYNLKTNDKSLSKKMLLLK